MAAVRGSAVVYLLVDAANDICDWIFMVWIVSVLDRSSLCEDNVMCEEYNTVGRER